ncbi:nucleoside 2-deoxyribosyltransferase [Levilactobacillus acidifarinae]|uniref:Nucleoside 2-deoxyribosyltransferase n=1 Tax=Levilactobacillus acidifarinae DSM 19394 = JCM 15949 TaxID=1423715 RepID=A0A0R1LSP2_9LACO|nr:nucleoside 2-deoxyribosyltransferase domain-containing protein [Levilactobacillus acidifarinae]KRK95817.1 hypothetical protein FD25_GL002273 [Levilactobacillus acidifarinae DSM 19394]GEO69116.1 nucleoside deoxyribosyltransferase [Levilactobacillus acidifarinae]
MTRVNTQHPQVYLAGPWFNAGEPERLAQLESLMDELRISYYSPRLDGIDLTPDATDADRDAVFADNTEHLKAAQLVLAVVDDYDTGTIWETGMAFGREIPVAYYAETLKDGVTFNVMLAKSAVAVLQNRDQARIFLQDPTTDRFAYHGAIR